MIYSAVGWIAVVALGFGAAVCLVFDQKKAATYCAAAAVITGVAYGVLY